ncbi:MAG: acetolactate synthase 3 large subunit, partial [Rhodospirillales bacterium]
LEDVIRRMIETDGPVIADIRVDQKENCFPMIPSGAAHNEMLMGPNAAQAAEVSDAGKALV